MRAKPIAWAILFAVAGTPALAEEIREARVGVPYEVRLEGNPGTGYAWRYDAAASQNPGLVDVTAQGYGDPESSMPGAPAYFSFTVTPLAPGTAALTFQYVRPWETEPIRQAVHRVEIAR
jgi:predicted secreted protein